MIPRDPTDGRLRERTTASFIVSLIIHALVALLFFSVLTSSSEQSAPESLEGSSTLTVSRVRVVQRKSAPPVVHPPQTNAPRVGPPKARPVLAGHPPVTHHRELAKQNPKAPANPTPAPAAPFSPNPQPSQVAIAMPRPAPLPEVPQRVPNAPPVAMKQTVATPQPTVAPATPAPSPKPTPAPQQRATVKPVPASPAPTAGPTAAPSKAPVVAASSAPVPKPSPAAGIASPSPTSVPSPSAQRGTSATPGPKPLSSAGKIPLPLKAQPARPIQLPPTPTPPPPTPRPKPSKTPSAKRAEQLNDLRNRLLSALPHAPVTPTQGHYNGTASIAKPGDPSPPPDVLARTKFIYEAGGAKGFKLFGGSEQRMKMYVTSIKKHGALSTCTGWVVRYPQGSAPAFGRLDSSGKLNTGYPGRGGANSYEPVIETNATFECETSRLQPFTPPPAPSPSP